MAAKIMTSGGPTSVLRGAALTVGMRWTDRLIGFVSTIILARLLEPSDLGIIAMVSLVVAFVDVFLDLGVNIALIQNRNPTPAHYNTAWTLRILQTITSAAIVCLVAGWAAAYFDDDRLQPVLWCMAIGMVFSGMENIGVVTFQKEMRFGLDFRFTFTKRVVAFVLTIVAAWILRSYWALVFATVASRVVGTLLSYFMHDMRPRLSLEKSKEIFAVSFWILMRGIGSYLHLNLHRIYVGAGSSASVMGGYSLATEISSIPNNELLSPLNRVIFPSFVRIKHDLSELRRVFLLAQGLQTMIAVPCSVGLAITAPEAVTVLLGQKWLFIVPYVQLLSIANIIFSITTTCGYVMITLGHTMSSALFVWIQIVVFMLLVEFHVAGGEAVEIAWARVATVCLALPVSIYLLRKAISVVTVQDIALTTFRPLLATGAMYIVLQAVHPLLVMPALASLCLMIGLGGATYILTTAGLWIALGRPAGAESYMLEKIVAFRSRSK
jgi:lipopolysaccharide exporter